MVMEWSLSNLHPPIVRTVLANYNKVFPIEIIIIVIIINTQGVSGGIVNILGGGSMAYSE